MLIFEIIQLIGAACSIAQFTDRLLQSEPQSDNLANDADPKMKSIIAFYDFTAANRDEIEKWKDYHNFLQNHGDPFREYFLMVENAAENFLKMDLNLLNRKWSRFNTPYDNSVTGDILDFWPEDARKDPKNTLKIPDVAARLIEKNKGNAQLGNLIKPTKDWLKAKERAIEYVAKFHDDVTTIWDFMKKRNELPHNEKIDFFENCDDFKEDFDILFNRIDMVLLKYINLQNRLLEEISTQEQSMAT